jgi:preprotein translocase subunit SecA
MKTLETLESFSSAVNILWPASSSPRRQDHKLVRAVRERADSHQRITDQQIAEHTQQLQQAVQTGTSPVSKDILLSGFALVTEAMRRVLDISFYDVQLLAGLALARGKIAEMQTGEGKTFVALLPAFIHALHGKGVHVLTVNDYLAQRDYELIRPVFNLLGMSAGFLQPASTPEDKHQAYACDITYGPGYEFGFDYLRDQAALLAMRKPRLGERYRGRLRGRQSAEPQKIQRGFHFCVVDEIDSVLIDEATTPLLLSEGVAQQAAHDEAYLIAQESAETLTEQQDYLIDRVGNRVSLTTQGIRAIAENGRRAAQHGLLRPWAVYVRQALHAQSLIEKDTDYIVDDEKVLLVDKNTGRIFPDRSWRDGLHQAVEAKEGLPINPEQQPLGHITRQRFFRLYEGKCGMTGTAAGNESELQYFYRLPVVVIPTHKPNQRKQLPSRYFANRASKFAAIIDEIARIHATGQPILVGTRTIEISEVLAEKMRAKKLPFRLLNGKQDEEEAQIVSRAGELRAITIATNMAGRGTDIKLGPKVSQSGGLHVIATERHESARVDRQLIGRVARQGDPGSCQYFVSAEDHLITLYAPALSKRMQRASRENGEVDVDFSGELAKVQLNVERLNFAQRQQMFAHDHWLDGVLSTLAEE